MWLSESLAIPNGGGPIGSREYTPLVDDSGRVVPVERAGFAPVPEPIPSEPPRAAVPAPIGVPVPNVVVPFPETIVEPGMGHDRAAAPVRSQPSSWMATRPRVPADVDPVPFRVLPTVARFTGAQPVLRDRVGPSATTVHAVTDPRALTLYPTPEFTRPVLLGPSVDRPPQPIGSTTRAEDSSRQPGSVLVAALAIAAIAAAVWYSR